jgi:hypothetical protein
VSDANLQTLARLVAMSPFARFGTTAERLYSAQRPPLAKALSTLTGMNISDVDVERQQAREEREALHELMARSPHLRQIPGYGRRYGAELTTEEEDLLREQAAMNREARQRARLRALGL